MLCGEKRKKRKGISNRRNRSTANKERARSRTTDREREKVENRDVRLFYARNGLVLFHSRVVCDGSCN